MAKSNFLQTPEQRDRANYYKKQRRARVGETPLLREAMVQEQFIETPVLVEEEPVFEYATPNMPSSSEFMASYDTGTDGIWADTIADVTGQAMSVVESAFKYMGEKKNRRADAVELDVAERMKKMPSALNEAMIQHQELGTPGLFDKNAFIKEYENTTRLQGIQAMANIQYSAEDQQEIISEFLAKNEFLGFGDGYGFEEANTEEKIAIMEYALFDRKLDPTINGERTISRVEKMRLGLDGAMKYDREALMKESVKLEERIKNSRLAPLGLTSKQFNTEVYSSKYIDNSVLFLMDTRRGGDPNNPVSYNPTLGENANGDPITLFTQDEAGLITFSSDPEVLKREYPEYMDEIGYAQAANFYAINGDPSFVQYAPEQIIDAAQGFNRGDISSASVLLPYLSIGGEQTVISLLNMPSTQGGASLNATQKSEILLALTLYESMDRPDLNRVMREMQDIGQMSFQRTRQDFDTLISKRDDRSFTQRQSVYEVVEGLKFEDATISESTDLNLSQRPELSSILSLLSVIEKSNIAGGDELKDRIINAAAFTPVVDSDGNLVDIIVGNSWHQTAHKAAGGSEELLIASSLIVPEPYLRLFTPDNIQQNQIDPILRNLTLEDDNEIMAEQGWIDAVIAESSSFGNQQGIQPQDLYRTMILMSPEVQVEIFNRLGEENRSYDTLEDIQKNYEDLKKREDSSIQYKMANRSSIRTRAENVPGAAGYAFNVDTITIGDKVIDVNPFFTSQDSSNVVFEIDWTGVPDVMERDEQGRITNKTKNYTTLDRVSNHIKKFVDDDGNMNITQKGWNFFIGQPGTDEAVTTKDPILLDDIPEGLVSQEVTIDKGFYQESQEILDRVTELDPQIQYDILEKTIMLSYSSNQNLALSNSQLEQEERLNQDTARPVLESMKSFLSSKNARDNGLIDPSETMAIVLNQYFENLPEYMIEEAKGIVTDKNINDINKESLVRWSEEADFFGGPAWNSMSNSEKGLLAMDMIRYLKEQQVTPVTRKMSDIGRTVRPEFDNPYIPEPMPSGYKNEERVIRSSLDDKPMRLESYFYTQDDSPPSQPFILSEKDPMGQEKLINMDKGIMNPSELSVSEYNDIITENSSRSLKVMRDAKEFIVPRINDAVKEIRKRYNFNMQAKDIRVILDNEDLFRVTYSGVYNKDRDNANLNDLLEGIILNAIHYSYEPKPSTGDN